MFYNIIYSSYIHIQYIYNSFTTTTTILDQYGRLSFSSDSTWSHSTSYWER